MEVYQDLRRLSLLKLAIMEPHSLEENAILKTMWTDKVPYFRCGAVLTGGYKYSPGTSFQRKTD